MRVESQISNQWVLSAVGAGGRQPGGARGFQFRQALLGLCQLIHGGFRAVVLPQLSVHTAIAPPAVARAQSWALNMILCEPAHRDTTRRITTNQPRPQVAPTLNGPDSHRPPPARGGGRLHQRFATRIRARRFARRAPAPASSTIGWPVVASSGNGQDVILRDEQLFALVGDGRP